MSHSPRPISFPISVALLSLLVATAVVSRAQSSPEVHADRTVTFRLRAPHAKEVVLRSDGLKDPRLMQQDDKGVWSVTIGPMEPDFYTASFTVDGVRALDPGNPLIKYNLFSTENRLHVPGPKDLPWEINDVPHGVIHRQHYRSAIVGEEREVLVYTPPGYDPAAKQTYPVLYLLHGYSDGEDAWTTVGRANIILDNLIARGEAQPMVIVMPLGYGNRQIVADRGALRGPGGDIAWRASNENYGKSLVEEIIPLIEKSYRVSPDRAARGIAGLSMGGTQSLLYGLKTPGRFAWVGSFSAGKLGADFDADFAGVTESVNDRVRLLWIGCGMEESLIVENRKFAAWLKARGVRHTWVEAPGRHNFRLWRRILAQFTPLLQTARLRETPKPRHG